MDDLLNDDNIINETENNNVVTDDNCLYKT